jgi:hypothetical protein
MKFFRRKQKVELSYYQRKQKRLRRARAKKKYALIVIFLLILPAMMIEYHVKNLQASQDATIRAISDNSVIEAIKTRTEALRAKQEKLDKYDEELESLGTMGAEIKRAGIEFGDDEDEAQRLIGLMIGIANAESSLGKNFVIEYDKNCHNWWGLKGGNMIRRNDGSSLRCFLSEQAGARTTAKTLKLYYLNEGRTTPEKIANKWVGRNQTAHHTQWVRNVNYYYKK